MFYPPEEMTDDPVDYGPALEVCSGCPVDFECLEEAMRVEDVRWRYGVAGGKTPTERRALRRARLEHSGSGGKK